MTKKVQTDPLRKTTYVFNSFTLTTLPKVPSPRVAKILSANRTWYFHYHINIIIIMTILIIILVILLLLIIIMSWPSGKRVGNWNSVAHFYIPSKHPTRRREHYLAVTVCFILSLPPSMCFFCRFWCASFCNTRSNHPGTGPSKRREQREHIKRMFFLSVFPKSQGRKQFLIIFTGFSILTLLNRGQYISLFTSISGRFSTNKTSLAPWILQLTSLCLILDDVSQLVGKMAIFVILNRADLTHVNVITVIIVIV